MSRAGLARLYAQTMVGISRAFLQFTKIKMIQNVTKAEEQLVKSVSKTGGGQMGWPFSMAEESGGGHATPWP